MYFTGEFNLSAFSWHPTVVTLFLYMIRIKFDDKIHKRKINNRIFPDLSMKQNTTMELLNYWKY